MTNTKDPIISVVLPTYNHGKYINRAINSVLQQTYQDFELIIIDNYSTDDTLNIIANFNTNKIKVLRINNRGTIAASRNFGIINSRGKFIAFIDSDDWWHPTKLQNCVEELNNGYDVVYHRLRYYSLTTTEEIRYHHLLDTLDITKDVLGTFSKKEGNALTTSGVIVRKQCIEDLGYFDEAENLVGAEDFDLWFRLAQKKYNFKYLPNILAFYLKGGNHITSAKRGLSTTAYITKKHFNDEPPIWLIAARLVIFIKLLKWNEFSEYIYSNIKQHKIKLIYDLIGFIARMGIRRIYNRLR